MDIYAYIKRDHRKLAGMMGDVLAIRLPTVRQTLFQQIRAELMAHSQSEEQTFYTAVEAAASESLREQLGHSVYEHHEIADLLAVLNTAPISSEFWAEKFGELRQAVAHHVEQEETDVFPKARTLLSPAVERQLAKDMDALKQALLQDFELGIPAIQDV